MAPILSSTHTGVLLQESLYISLSWNKNCMNEVNALSIHHAGDCELYTIALKMCRSLTCLCIPDCKKTFPNHFDGAPCSHRIVLPGVLTPGKDSVMSL